MTSAPFKASTFIKKRNTLRDAIRSQGSPEIQAAWDAFEGYTDCLTMEDATQAYAEGREAGLRDVTIAQAAKVILNDRWGGYGHPKAMEAMWMYFSETYDRRPFPQSHYDGAFQAALRALALIENPHEGGE